MNLIGALPAELSAILRALGVLSFAGHRIARPERLETLDPWEQQGSAMGSKSEPVLVSPDLAGRLFHFVMIKPTHYDDDGYPIQWFRSAIPSNTLACLNGLAEDAHRRNVLGPDVEIRLHTYDETNRRVQPDRIIREIRKAGARR
jgi:hypothetical protein